MFMKKYLFFLFTLCFCCVARGQTGYDYYYWFDNDDVSIQSGHTESSVWSIEADMNGLDESLHVFHLQIKNDKGVESAPLSYYFLKQKDNSEYKGYYWFDGNYSSRQSLDTNQGLLSIDVSKLSDGFHTFFYQVFGDSPSAVLSRPFVKIPMTEGSEALKCICYVDGQPFREENISSGGGIINWNLDVRSLSQGFHRMHVQVLTHTGAATSSYEAYFLRIETNDEMLQMKCYYAIDGSEFKKEAVNMSGSTFLCELDVSDLTDGLHSISYMLSNGKGMDTKIQSQFFVKTPVGGNGITEYCYWLNDSTNQITKVQVPQRSNPFQLVSLLPVPEIPIRTRLFHFELTEGTPMIYSKNEIHIRFMDATGRLADATKQFTDYHVGQEVVPVGELQSTQMFDKVADNDIRWYTMQAAPGDTAAFKLSQPATVQVFAPSGNEVFKTSEYESVNWNGIHTWEDGTYYVAVHDVTGSQSTMTLDYMHMDKYDVVDWDVHTVGNGGCSTITFKGNGFRDLYAVDLVIAPGDTIHSVDVGHESDAETAVTFDFTGVTLGDYNAVFHFTEENKHIANVVTVEEAIDIELATDVSFPSSFLRGSTITYTYAITNIGNMTAYCVPIYIYCETPNIGGITHLKIDGLNLSSIIEGVNTENLNPTERNKLEVWANQIGDDHYFLRIKKADNNTNDSVIVRSNYFTITLPPYGTREIRLQLTSNQSPNVWFTSLKTLPPFSVITNNYSPEYNGFPNKYKSAPKGDGIKDWYCCIRERTECMLDRVAFCFNRTSLLGTDGAIGLAASGLFLGPEMLVPSAVVLEAAQGVGTAGSLLNLFSTNSKVYGNAISRNNGCCTTRNHIWHECIPLGK